MATHQIRKSLTYSEAIEVWKLRAEGSFQHNIAAKFGVNPARVNDVLKERKHVGSRTSAGEII
ncbi:hypothetical protein [Mesorhizobium sp.]|uniref:hypothetical protein n=1 Tax=Mesorhizobium sp. TaxID=1871066 RepID=UPI000FE7C2A4|nr:hypothetical protein [Mesorhizobium sp.]RWO52378.1 MAG: hypothetical protein EOS13_14340 [Mesorhizobium sp.]TIN26475.1 MAG: hypothetical protein E5Y19_14025 [Mesorhizobium sp.]TIN35884.1 MAG: hypothetical protein E5Y13_26130 [Mesorhizobium sp.]TJU80110.1 MAG: hypothetical protein E5Y15_22600 [Mesorhizobium sp.]TJU84635.1 MAG: hypothetical protein E5Y10_29280 [Mesorhizobium sp.]